MIYIWATGVSVVLALASGADLRFGNLAFIMLDGAVMFVLGGTVPGLVYFLFRHRIEQPKALFVVWAIAVTIVGLTNFVAWMFV